MGKRKPYIIYKLKWTPTPKLTLASEFAPTNNIRCVITSDSWKLHVKSVCIFAALITCSLVHVTTTSIPFVIQIRVSCSMHKAIYFGFKKLISVYITWLINILKQATADFFTHPFQVSIQNHHTKASYIMDSTQSVCVSELLFLSWKFAL